MGANAFIDLADLAVEPGAETSRDLRIVNTGRVVDQFTIDVVGAIADWANAEPGSVNLLPGAEETVTVFFRPPRSPEVAPGETPFGVRVMSREDTAGSVVEEGTIDVGSFIEVKADVVPRTQRARRKGKFQIAVDNHGNAPADVDIDIADEENKLRFKPARTAHSVPAGETRLLPFRAIPRKRIFKGAEIPLPFVVTVTPRESPGDQVASAGKLNQQPLFPKWLLPALLVAMAAVVAFAVMWQTMLKPALKSTARDAALEETTKVAAAAEEAQQQAEEAEAAAEEAGGAAEEARVAAGLPPADAPPGTGNTVPDRSPSEGSGGMAVDFRIATTSPPVTNAAFQLFGQRVPADKSYFITDIVLQNPAGDTGTLQIRRGTAVLIEVGMSNFRDLDYHFVQALKFGSGQDIIVAVNCRNPGTTACTPSVYFGGRQQ